MLHPAIALALPKRDKEESKGKRNSLRRKERNTKQGLSEVALSLLEEERNTVKEN